MYMHIFFHFCHCWLKLPVCRFKRLGCEAFCFGLDFDVFVAFMTDVSDEIDRNDEEGSVYSVFEPVFKKLHSHLLKDVKLGDRTTLLYADMMILFSCNMPMAKVR